MLLAFRTPGDRSDPIGPTWFEEAVRDITALGGLTVVAVAILVMWLSDIARRRPRAAWFHLVAVLLGVALVFWLKGDFARPRPSLVPHAARVLTSSFPSGHAATAALAHLTIGANLARSCRYRRLKQLSVVVAVVLSLAVAVSRVYLGVHWPSDVVAGWIVGAAWAWSVWTLEGFLRARGKIEPLT